MNISAVIWIQLCVHAKYRSQVALLLFQPKAQPEHDVAIYFLCIFF